MSAEKKVRLVQNDLPLVKLLTTGGTIATKNGGDVILTGDELVKTVPKLREIAYIEVEDVVTISSCDIDSSIWRMLSKRISEVLADPRVTGVVVTHGTDTMEETAFFLDLTLATEKPVILSGAMRRPSEFDADGPRNLLNAVRVAVSPESRGKGVLLVMNSQINAARDVTKTNTSSLETFKSLEFGQLGVVDRDGSVRFYRTPLRRQTIPLDAEAKLGRIEIVLSYAGADGLVMRSLLSQDCLDGLVVAGTGSGNVSRAMYDAIKEARDRQIPIVISTRVYTGRVKPLSGSLGTSYTLQKLGCVLADNLSPQKARIMLMLVLGKTRKPEEIERYFNC